ncbi:hypothetical protein SHKM778_50420 [Streptomyces sp. KM77-8]|uniref:Uncharacterized protein n=1 Tax=Streptomyces haneummycinicus TaxID=3074435 RepID=A0AAT9HMW6_9ACTN
MQGTVDGQRADRSEAQPLGTGPQLEYGGTLDVGAVLRAGDGGDGEGTVSVDMDMWLCQLLRLPPVRALPAGILMS